MVVQSEKNYESQIKMPSFRDFIALHGEKEEKPFGGLKLMDLTR